MIFPDLILDSCANEIAHEMIEISNKRCAHCNRRIVGKVYEMAGKYYDSYCWQFRHILQLSEKDDRHDKERKLFRDE